MLISQEEIAIKINSNFLHIYSTRTAYNYSGVLVYSCGLYFFIKPIPSSTLADPPLVPLGGNAVPLTVIRLTGSDEVTVCMAFPAYIVLTNSLSPLIPMISDIGATSSLAASLGMRFY